jgi:hypothetical protein
LQYLRDDRTLADVVVLDAAEPSRLRADLELSRTVVDEEYVGPDGLVRRRWAGTPEALAACARVNPLSARLFATCERIRTARRPLVDRNGVERGHAELWEWFVPDAGKLNLVVGADDTIWDRKLGDVVNSPAFVTSAAQSTSTASATETISYTVATGSNRLLLAGGVVRGTNTLSGITFDGGSLSAVTDVLGGSADANGRRVYLQRLVAPAEKTADLVATFSASTNVRGLAAMNFTGADQTTPLGTPTTVGNPAAAHTTTSVSVASGTDDLVADFMTVSRSDEAVGADQTQRCEAIFITGAYGSTKAGAVTSTTMSWTFGSTSVASAQIGVAIKSVSAGGANPKGVFGLALRGPLDRVVMA